MAADLSSCLGDFTADEVGGGVDLFWLAQAAGVGFAIWLIARSPSPGRIEARQSRIGMFSRSTGN